MQYPKPKWTINNNGGFLVQKHAQMFYPFTQLCLEIFETKLFKNIVTFENENKENAAFADTKAKTTDELGQVVLAAELKVQFALKTTG